MPPKVQKEMVSTQYPKEISVQPLFAHMKTLLLSLSLLCLIGIAACQKEELRPEDGRYSGTFSVNYGSSTQSGQTTLELKQGRFTCSAGENHIPAGGSGTFSISDRNISFTDENIWTANFDWNLILNGTYSYRYDGKTLQLSADKFEIGQYNYVLEKQ